MKYANNTPGFIVNTGTPQYVASTEEGAEGPEGPEGPQGPAGPTGPPGADGDDGAPGATGAKGDKGDTGTAGTNGTNGSQGIQGIQGIQGPTGAAGTNGSNGTNGTNGVDGKTVLNGSGTPSSGQGNNGDFYVNTAATTIYGPKTAGAWGSPTSLVGPTGPTGSAGTNGTNGSNGTNGATWRQGSGVPSNGTGVDGDLYFRTSTGDIYVRSSGAYGIVANITGPQGVAGTNGTNGSNGATGATGSTGATGPAGPTTGGALNSANFIVGNASNIATAVTMSGDGALSNTGALTVPALQKPAKLGSLTVIGHSYTVGTTQNDTGTSNPLQESLIAKLQGLLGIHENNVVHLGTAGSAISQATNLFVNRQMTGWNAAWQFMLPNNNTNINAASDTVVSDPVTGVNGAGVIVHGVNDYLLGCTGVTVADDAQSTANNLVAAGHGYRAVLSRLRSGVVYGSTVNAGTIAWDAPIAFSGGSNVASVTQNTGPAYRNFTTNGNTFTFTIPTNFTGGTIAVNLVGQQQGVTHLTGSLAASGAVSPLVAANSQFPASGTLVIKIDNEEMIVTAGLGTNTWTVTSGNRGANGTTAAAHSANAVVRIAPDTYKVNWSTSGSNAGITGSTIVGGQGSVNSPISITKRFVCTSADAGKTIVGTVAGLIAADTSGAVIFDSVQFEDAAPPPIVLTNVHHWNFAEFPYSSQISSTYIAAFNTAIASVVAEFDNFVQIADVYTPFFNRNGVTTASMNATDTSTAIGWTANSTSFTPTVGMMFSFGPSVAGSPNAEHCVCTAVSGSAPNWTLTLTRGSGGTTKVVHSSGAFLGPLQWMHTDNLHLTAQGHAVYAQTIYDAFSAMPTPAQYQLAGSSGNWTEGAQSFSMGIVDSNWVFPACNNFGAAATTNALQFAFPTYIPRMCILTGMSVAVTTGSTGLFRFGIYMPDYTHSRPGRLLQDFGAYTLAGTAPYQAKQQGFYQILRPGWYWISCAQQTTAVTLLTFGVGGMSTPVLSRTTPPNSSLGQLVGYYQTGISGAFADWTTYNEMLGSASSATSGMCIYYQLRSTPLA